MIKKIIRDSPSFFLNEITVSELDINGFAVKNRIDLLVGPAEELLVKVPEVHDKQDTDSSAKHLKQFL